MKGYEEGLMNVLPECGQEGSGQKPVLAWAFLPIYVPHYLLHLCDRERG